MRTILTKFTTLAIAVLAAICGSDSFADDSGSATLRRGVMLPSGYCSEGDFRTLRSWGVNLARFQLARGWGKVRDNQDVAEYRAWVNERLDQFLRDVVVWAEKYDIDLVLDLHVPPGGVEASGEMVMFHDPRFAAAFIETWKDIASRCVGQKRIWGYDLINEPVQNLPSETGDDYRALQEKAARAVRAIDPHTPIIFESNLSCAPHAYANLEPIPLENVIYQVHMYAPMAYTHQDVHTKDSSAWRPLSYPNAAKGWNREMLAEALRPVREFQQRTASRIYVGEFSAVSWAVGADRYLTDCISLFEEYGWDWTYHAFREWRGWSVEHEADEKHAFVPSADNPRKRALLNGFRPKDPNLCVFLSDIHCNAKLPGDWMKHQHAILRRYVNEILATRPLPAHVVVFGDFSTSTGWKEDFQLAREILMPLLDAGIELACTMGNHDKRKSFLDVFPEYRGRSPVKDRIVSRLELPTCDLILLDSLREKEGEGDNFVDGRVEGEQLNWLRKELAEAKRPIIVGAHHSAEECGIRRDLVRAPTVCGFVYGHEHMWSDPYLHDGTYGNSQTVQTAILPSSGFWGDIGYALFRTFEDRAELTLRQDDFFFNRSWPDRPRPKNWQSRIDAHQGAKVVFYYEKPGNFWHSK